MQYWVKMKTGYYETTRYALSVFEGGIQLLPAEDRTKDIIHVLKDDLIVITLTRKKNPEIEIKARNQMFTGTFLEKLDLFEVHHELKKYISTKVIYEEK